jgi:hypothetical protein
MIAPMRTWVLALAVMAAGCGPIAYINQVTRDASTKVDHARTLQADKYSPYYWTRATQYLRMAREVAAHADFQGANHFGRLASEAAAKAAEEAEIAARDPSKRPMTLDEGVAPAKDGGAVAPAKGDGSIAPAKDE